MSEWTPAGVLTSFENRSGAEVNFFKEGPESESFFEYEVSLHNIGYYYFRLFFYKVYYNFNFKCEKLLHWKSKNFNTTWMEIRLGG